MDNVTIERIAETDRSLTEHLSTSRSEEDGNNSFQKIPPSGTLGNITTIEVNTGVCGCKIGIVSISHTTPPISRNKFIAKINTAWRTMRFE